MKERGRDITLVLRPWLCNAEEHPQTQVSDNRGVGLGLAFLMMTKGAFS